MCQVPSINSQQPPSFSRGWNTSISASPIPIGPAVPTQRCFASLVTINKLKHVLPRTTTKTLIECLVFPHIRYCLPAWAPATALQRKRIDKVINFAVRVATGKRKHDRITEARKNLRWLSFDQTVFLRDCVSISDVNRKPKFWFPDKIPKPIWFLVFQLKFSWYFVGFKILTTFRCHDNSSWQNFLNVRTKNVIV